MKIEQASFFDILKSRGGSDIISKIRRKYLLFLSSVVNIPTAFDVNLPVENKKLQYIIDVFQNANIVETMEENVKRCFKFHPFTDERNINLQNKGQSCESVAIHVRKVKDYAQRIWYKNTCLIEYYHKAIRLISEKVNSPKLYVFTDNPEWVKEHFKDFPYTLVEGNPARG